MYENHIGTSKFFYELKPDQLLPELHVMNKNILMVLVGHYFGCRESFHGGERMVLFQPERPKISDRPSNQPSHRSRILENNRERQGDLSRRRDSRHEENPSILQRESSEG